MSEELPKSNHYVDKVKLHAALVEYVDACRAAAAEGKPKPRVPEYIGKSILDIATKFSFSAKYNANFIGYPFREDMVMDGAETCVRGCHNYDYERFNNPHAYFTQVIYYAFLNRIQKEKKYLYGKFKSIQAQRDHGIMADSQEHEELAEFGVEIQDNSDYMNDYIRNYEASAAKKLNEKKPKKSKGATLDVLDEVELDVEAIDFGDMPDPDIDAQE